MPYQCTICGPNSAIFQNLAHMRSHLGSQGPGHNMGPFACGVQNCNLRAARGDLTPWHGQPVTGHRARFGKDAALDTALTAFAIRCQLPAPAAGPPAGPPAPPPPPPPPPPPGPAFGPASGSGPVPRPAPFQPPNAGSGTGSAAPSHDPNIDPRLFHPNAPPILPPHGSPFRIYLHQYIVPTVTEGMRLLKLHEPEKPLKALAEFVLGNDNITGSTRSSGFSYSVVNSFVEEANKALHYRWASGKHDDPKKWYAAYLLARSTETER